MEPHWLAKIDERILRFIDWFIHDFYSIWRLLPGKLQELFSVEFKEMITIGSRI